MPFFRWERCAVARSCCRPTRKAQYPRMQLRNRPRRPSARCTQLRRRLTRKTTCWTSCTSSWLTSWRASSGPASSMARWRTRSARIILTSIAGTANASQSEYTGSNYNFFLFRYFFVNQGCFPIDTEDLGGAKINSFWSYTSKKITGHTG